MPSLSDLSNLTRSEKIPSFSDLSNSTRSEKNTHSLRFPYTHAYQYKYRIPRKCKTNNKLIKVVQILGKIEEKKKNPGSIGEMKNKGAILWFYRKDQQPPAMDKRDLKGEENRHYSGVVEQLDW